MKIIKTGFRGTESYLNNPVCYDDMSSKEKQTFEEWIQSKFEKSKSIYSRASSYGLKHDFTRERGTYVTNGAFKGGMLAAGFTPADETEWNWHFKMQEKVPDGFYAWCLKRYKHRDTPLGDFTRDMKGDYRFPKAATDKAEIREYLYRRHACAEAVRAFEIAWRYYEKSDR